MLKINHSHHIDFPHLSLGVPHEMQLSQVPVDQDELVQDIAHDVVDHDDNWELTERPDGNELALYLQNIVSEDPDKINFASE